MRSDGGLQPGDSGLERGQRLVERLQCRLAALVGVGLIRHAIERDFLDLDGFIDDLLELGRIRTLAREGQRGDEAGGGGCAHRMKIGAPGGDAPLTQLYLSEE